MIVMMGFAKEFIAIVTTMGNVMNPLWRSSCGKVRITHPESCGKVEVRRQLFVGPELLELVPSGNLLHSYWKYRIWFVDLPIQNGDVP